MTPWKADDFYFWIFPKGIENGQTVRMAVGSREILITFRVSLFVPNAALVIEICWNNSDLTPSQLFRFRKAQFSGGMESTFTRMCSSQSLKPSWGARSKHKGSTRHSLLQSVSSRQLMSAPGSTSCPVHAKYRALLSLETFQWTFYLHLLCV